MKLMFAPWRIKYILSKKPKGCVFCKALKKKDNEKNFILRRNQYCFTILNLYPYTNGHLMVVPYKHTANVSDLTKNELSEIWQEIQFWVDIEKKTMHTDGFNIGMNIGQAAGAGIETHLHFHIVPRWVGDSNFMPVLGKTKVIPQSLKDIYKQLKENIN